MGTLEEDLIECFRKRDIEVETLTVEDGASKYTIKVKRVCQHCKTEFVNRKLNVCSKCGRQC